MLIIYFFIPDFLLDSFSVPVILVACYSPRSELLEVVYRTCVFVCVRKGDQYLQIALEEREELCDYRCGAPLQGGQPRNKKTTKLHIQAWRLHLSEHSIHCQL